MKNMKKFAAVILALLTLCAVLTAPAAAEEIAIDPQLILNPKTTLTVFADGVASDALSDSYPYGQQVSLTAPAVAGKTFLYWANGEGTAVSYSETLTLNMYADTTLNAVYGEAAAAGKTTAAFLNITRTDGEIVFNAIASASGDITEAGIRYSTTQKTVDQLKGAENVTAAAADDPSANWTLVLTPQSEDTVYYAVAYATAGGQTVYSEVQEVRLSALESGMSMVLEKGNLNLGAINAQFCQITFEANGGEGAMAPQGVVMGESTVLNANAFTRQGYTFAGWATTDKGNVVYRDGDSAILSGDVTLYAQWKSNAAPTPAPAAPTAGPLTVTSEIGTITRVTVDGKALDSRHYFVSGSNVVLSEEFMNTLAPGKHTIRVYDGKTYATATWTVEGSASAASQAKTAATGDRGLAPYTVLAVCAAVALCAIVGYAIVSKKRRVR